MSTKTKYLLCLFSFLFSNGFFSIYSQPNEEIYLNELNNQYCGTEELLTDYPFFPVDNDTLRILVIFAKFPDDTWDPAPPAQPTIYWPGNLGSQIPTWASGIIKPNTNNIGICNMTNYYKEASMGKFWLIGDVYPNLYVFQHNHGYYLPDSNRHIGYATKELLENLNPYIDYSIYDKFAPNDPVNRRHPDGQVDFILIIFRFLLNTEPTTGSGIAALGGSNHNFGSTNQIVLDNKIISANHPGSGAIATQLTPWGYNIACHELGHYIFGMHRNHMGLFNLMNVGGNSFVSSDEREFAGWAPSPYIPTGNSTYILDDYGTSGQYIKFTKGRYTYYLEYRKRNLFHLSNSWTKWPFFSFNPITPMTPDEGLLIQRYYNSLEAANGKWYWKMSDAYPNRYMVDSVNNGRYTNVFFHDKPNRILGETIINLDDKPAVDIHTNLPFFKNKTHGSSSGDSNTCFDVGYNQVYSPWSNPSSIVETQSDSVVIEIEGKTKMGNLKVNIYFNNLTESTPAKPQNLQISRQYLSNPDNAYHPILNWYRNLEPDFQKYYIYRSQVYSPGVDPSYYYLIGETTDSVFLDESLTLYRSGGGSEPCEYVLKQFYYKISAIDFTNKESVKSERDSISGYLDPCQSWIPPGGIDNFKIQNNLYQNYPNPFNPKTSIRYSLEYNGFVSITIFDILGRVVKTLVSENKISGEHIIDFDGSNLASGIYFCKMKTDNYSAIKRLLLIK